jgi:hypothetical protein
MNCRRTSPNAVKHKRRTIGYGLEHLEQRLVLAGDWLSVLPDSRLLSELSIPSTHDALSDCANGCFPSGTLASQAQALSLQSQLDLGIRGLDIRVDHAFAGTTIGAPAGYSYFFGIVHGVVPMGYEFRDDVLQVVAGFLAAHPNEMILMSIQEQDALTPATGRAFIDTFEQYMNDTNPHTGAPYGNLFWQPVDGNGIPTGADYIPQLGETRGKIVLLQDGWDDPETARVQRWGLDYTKAEGGDPNDPGNARYYNPLFQKVDSSQNLHPSDRWANSRNFFVETAIGRHQTPAGQPKFYENSLASTTNQGLPGATFSHWDSPLEYATGKGCVVSDCRYEDGMNQRALSYLEAGQPRTAGIVYMDFPELGNTVDWNPDVDINWGSTLIDAIVEVNFGPSEFATTLEEVTFYDNPNAPGPGDIECQLFVMNNHGDTDFRSDNYNCDNDDAQSLTLRGVRAGTKLLVHDSPNFLDEADNVHIQIVRDIPGTYTIGSFEQTYNDDYVEMQYYGNGTLDGKVSAVRIAYNGITHPETDGAKPFNVRYMEAAAVPGGLQNLYQATNIFNDPTQSSVITRLHVRNYNTINFSGDAGRAGGEVFPQNETFPDGDARDRSDYFMQATANLEIPAGNWSIAFASDDGGQLTLAGIPFDSKFNVSDPENRSGSNQVWYNAQRAYAWTGGHFNVTAAQQATTLVASMFERSGGDAFEIAIRNNSDLQNSSTVSPANGWTLLKSGALGWTVGQPLPIMQLIEEGGSFRTDSENLASGKTAFAKDVLQNGAFAIHQIPHLNDGLYGNSNSWIGDSGSSFAGINLGSTPIAIDQLAFGRSNVTSGDPCPGGVCTDRSLGRYTFQYTTVPNPDASLPNGAWITFGQKTYAAGNPPVPHLRHLYAFEPILATGIRILTPVDAAIDEIELYGPSTNDPGQDITSPADIIFIANGTNDGDADFGPPPSNERVERALDNRTDKYLNFLDLKSGLIVTPNAGSTIINGLRLYTANDAPERDPASYRLEGSNSGTSGPFTLISEGSLALPDERNPSGVAIDGSQWHQEIHFTNTTSYATYRLTFPTLKNAGATNSMQIGELEFLGQPITLPQVVHRINAGGEAYAGDPAWSQDSPGNPSTFHDGALRFSTGTPIDVSHPSVPTGTPMELFQTERYPSLSSNIMQWDFPVQPGSYEVRLHFAEIFYDNIGDAVFDVEIEGEIVLPDYDILADVGAKFTGIVKSFTVTSDDTLDIDFHRIVSDPVVNAIEIRSNGAPLAGDFTGDGLVNALDINEIRRAINTGNSNTRFDVDGNGSVTEPDVRFLVENIIRTSMGDANLDFAVDGTDFNIWQTFRFLNSTNWSTGDFNGDGRTDASDFNLWNQNKFSAADAALADLDRVPRAPLSQLSDDLEPGNQPYVAVTMGKLQNRLRRSPKHFTESHSMHATTDESHDIARATNDCVKDRAFATLECFDLSKLSLYGARTGLPRARLVR